MFYCHRSQFDSKDLKHYSIKEGKEELNKTK